MFQRRSIALRFPLRPLSRLRGFTLQEMLVSVLISGTLAGGGIGIWNVIRQNAITTTANDLVAHLALARSEAIQHNSRIVMCPTRDDKNCVTPGSDYTSWQEGWLVFADKNGNATPDRGEIVRVHAAASRGVVVRSSRYRRRVTYRPMGTAGGSTITFAVCNAHDPRLARYVIVAITGRARVAKTTTSSVKCG